MDSVQLDRVIYENPSCELMITSKCNLSCSYCIAKELPGSFMNKEIGYKAIDYFIHLSEGANVLDFVFTGGEPLSEGGILEDFISYAVSKTNNEGMGARISIKTNGTLIKKSNFDFYKSSKSQIFISIDGIESVHNRHRTSGKTKNTFATVLSNIKLLIAENIPITVSMTVHPDSVDSVLQGVKELVNHGIYKINVAPSYGTVNWCEKNVSKFQKSLIDLAYYIRENKDLFPDLDIGPIYKNSEHTGGKLLNIWGCSAGLSNIAILPNGQITGCSSLGMMTSRKSELILGDVFNGVEDSKIDHLTNLTNANGELKDYCRICSIKKNCTGGCLAINLADNDHAFSPPNIYCQSIKTIDEAWSIAYST